MFEVFTALGLIIWIFFCHTFADFVFQTKWMAENKSKSLKALSVHIVEYITIMYFGLIYPFGFEDAAIYAVLSGIIHFPIDFVSSKLSSFAYKEEKLGLFWTIVGFDQFVHISCLLLLFHVYFKY